MNQQTVRVRNKLGLHARAAARLVRLTSQFSSEIILSRLGGSQAIDAKSILGVLMLAAAEGTKLVVSIQGEDETEAADAIRRLFEERFGEEA